MCLLYRSPARRNWVCNRPRPIVRPVAGSHRPARAAADPVPSRQHAPRRLPFDDRAPLGSKDLEQFLVLAGAPARHPPGRRLPARRPGHRGLSATRHRAGSTDRSSECSDSDSPFGTVVQGPHDLLGRADLRARRIGTGHGRSFDEPASPHMPREGVATNAELARDFLQRQAGRMRAEGLLDDLAP